MRFNWIRSVVVAWLCVLAAMATTALVKRHAEHVHLRTRLVAELNNIAEVSHQPVEVYLWDAHSTNWGDYDGPRQAIAIYLLNHGYASPDLERGLLLCEAMRVYDWKYLYPSVHNYDLRTRLIAHCTKDFPVDPLVHLAAGELTLAAGDYGQAVEELHSVQDLAVGQPGGTKAICNALGVSQQHMFGRYACALTVIGDWSDADAKALLAKQAGDGVDPPPAEDFESGYGDAAEQEQAAKADARREADRATARQYGLTHDPALIAPWLQQQATLLGKLAKLPESSEKANDLNSQLYEIDSSLLRAYLLAHDWDKAAAQEEAVAKLKNDAPYNELNAALRDQSGLLLTRLAKRQKLGLTAAENAEALRAELEKSYATMTDPYESAAQRQRELDDELEFYRQGELSGLLEADYLPFLLRTDLFADALDKSGRSLQDVLPEIQAVTQPERGLYSDSSNEKLRWK